MQNQSLFYKESGNVNIVGLAISYFTCLLFTMFLGYGYSILTSVIPIIYVNFLLTFILGISLAYLVKILVKLTHNRHRKSQIILAIITGLMANYFQWTTYVLYVYMGSLPSLNEYFQNLYWIIIPNGLIQNIISINKIGMWSVFGISFSGSILTIVWILEAVIIGLIPVVSIIKSNIFPYSEKQNRWYPKFILCKDFESISMVDRLIKSLNKEPVKAIEELQKENGLRHSKIYLYYLQNEDYQYLTFENIFFEGQGKGSKEKTVMIDNYRIPNSVADEIKNKYDHKRERYEII